MRVNRDFPVAKALVLSTVGGIGLSFLYFFYKLFSNPMPPTTPPPVVSPSPPVVIGPPSGPPIVGPPPGTTITPPSLGPPPIPTITPPPPTRQGPVTLYHVLSGPYQDPLQAQLAAELTASNLFVLAAIARGQVQIVTGLGTDGRYYVEDAKRPPP